MERCFTLRFLPSIHASHILEQGFPCPWMHKRCVLDMGKQTNNLQHGNAAIETVAWVTVPSWKLGWAPHPCGKQSPNLLYILFDKMLFTSHRALSLTAPPLPCLMDSWDSHPVQNTQAWWNTILALETIYMLVKNRRGPPIILYMLRYKLVIETAHSAILLAYKLIR